MSIIASAKSDWRGWIGQFLEAPDALTEDILQLVKKRAEEDDLGDSIRLSGSGSCARKLAYQHLNFVARKNGLSNIYEPEPANPRMFLVFQMGDLVEAALKDWLRKSKSLFMPTGKDDTVLCSVDGVSIPGHPDGIFQEPDGTLSVVDFKSISSIGFDAVEEEGPRYDNVCQVTAYMNALGLHQGRLLYYSKNTSHLISWRFTYSLQLWQQIEKRFRSAMKATPDTLPDREYAPTEETEWVRGTKQLGLKLPGDLDGDGMRITERKTSGYWRSTGREILTFPCSYCAFKKDCYGKDRVVMELDGDKPVFVVEAA